MKRIFLFTLLFLAAFTSAKAQETSVKNSTPDRVQAEIDSVNRLARMDFIDGKYKEAYDKWERLITDVAPQRSTTDSTYVELLTMKARCHKQLKNGKEAIATIKKAVDIWHEHCDTTAQFYAVILDNMASYLEADGNSKEAIATGKKALAVYDRLLRNDYDKACILIHLAESCNELELYADAIRYELQGLNIIKNELGEHSDNYIEELGYLSKYYRNAKQDKKADNIDARIEKLQKEADEGHGDIPEPFDFEDPKAYAAHSKDARRCAEYYLSHPITAPDMGDAVTYFMGWGSGCEDVMIFVDEEKTKMINDKEQVFCAMAYYAGCVKYAVDNQANKFSRDMFGSAVIDMINFYHRNDFFYTGKRRIAYIEKYLKAYDKDGMDGLTKIIDKEYDQIKKQAISQGIGDKLETE